MNVQLELGLSNIRNYRRLSYTAWHALAEFVDNSTQSYFDNRRAIDAQLASDGDDFYVRIVLDRNAGAIRISDNAMGMGLEELERAARIGERPPNPDGRSSYGLGMKTAGCWFSDHIEVISSKLGEPLEHSIEFDVERIASGDSDLRYSQKAAPVSAHYTRIVLSALHHMPQGRTVGRIKDHLRSMYRYDIGDGTLRLHWDGVPLEWSGPGDFLTGPDATPYRRDFQFEVNGKEAYGWVGILEHGSRAKAGFSILRKKRVVEGWPQAWRPQSLYGQRLGSNNLVNQRLVGEIHLDEFEVAHTKDAILWHEDEEAIVEEKLLEVAGDYKRRAQERRVSEESEGIDPHEIATAASELQAELESAAMVDRLTLYEMPPPEVVEAIFAGAKRSTLDSEPYFKARLETLDEPIVILVYLSNLMSPNDPYFIYDAPAPRQIQIIINLRHTYVSTLQGADDLIDHLRHCAFDGLAQWKASQRQDQLSPELMRSLKDQFMRVPMIVSSAMDDAT